MTSSEITAHLDDYLFLTFELLDSFASFKSESRIQDVLHRLLKKDGFLQEAVERLAAQQEMQKKISELRTEISRIDSAIMSFGDHLGNLEQSLYDAVHSQEENALKNLDGHVTQQTFKVHEVAALAEKLALMSAAPADFIERHGMSLCRPPAPQEDLLTFCRLHHTTEVILNPTFSLPEPKPSEPENSPASTVTSLPESLSTLDTLKPPPSWKPGDPLPLEHLKLLSSMSQPHASLPRTRGPEIRSAISFADALNPDLEESSDSSEGEDEED
eukprot:TRINITY_DN9491_c0_g1_i2.p1 TRINITY_DN9491_c0_g1~~TRINITY_DN9491_c0_g1_i2.p1  ORF type:complete len:298 (-),score=34.82 TRINITY_DN9491_c0_g1_i2:65-880(-)